MNNFRIGYGYDSHRFKDGEFIFIGGVKIPFDKGITAHSDGDVLLHAIGDALLGAAALGDLGQHFPDNDPKYRGISSQALLKEIDALLKKSGFDIVNIDATVVTELPKLASYILPMRTCLANLFNLSIDCINIKAKTNEKMGWIGRGEGLAAQAIALLSKSGNL
jgi:2-C-methyl-D-erythritol 2,4-cyclodiphosphate synthase